MSSINSRDSIIRIVRRKGTWDGPYPERQHPPDDAPVQSVWKYDTPEGGVCYKLIYNPGAQMHEFFTSPFVIAPRMLWEQSHGLTVLGALDLALTREELGEEVTNDNA